MSQFLVQTKLIILLIIYRKYPAIHQRIESGRKHLLICAGLIQRWAEIFSTNEVRRNRCRFLPGLILFELIKWWSAVISVVR